TENYRDLHAAGFLAICIPKAQGGLGADYQTYSILAAEIGRYCGATALTWNMHVCSTLWSGPLADDLDMDAATRAEHERRRSIHYRRIVEDGAIYSQPFSEGGAAAAGGAAVLERTAYRPLRRRNAARLSYLISAIGASFFVTYLFQQDFLLGPGQRSFPSILAAGEDAFGVTILDSRVTNPEILVVVGALICFIFLDRLINQTSTGRSIRALSEDPVASQLMGINVDRVIVTTFVIGGFFGGVAGAMYGLLFGNVVWNMGFIYGIKAFTAAVLGGIGNIRGAVLGALLLGLVENMSTVCLAAEWKNVVAFTLLPLVLIFRPTGIMGERIGG
nr:acyl-CoA dehydrogenase family protein [Actinomycetota bacterium]